MTDKKFTELVNLYFDKEISAADLAWLKSEIAACPDRKRVFAERCRLHRAMRLALKPVRSRSRRTSSRSKRSSSSRSRSKSRAMTSTTTISRYDESFSRSSAGLFPRWTLGVGLAASLAIGWTLLTPVFRDTIDASAQPALVGVDAEDLLPEDPLDSLGKSELRRYAAAQQQERARYHASLVAQMRLMGLRPELTPQDKQLREVGVTAHYEPKHVVRQAELFQRLQAQQLIPEPRLLQLQEMDSSSGPSWSGAFEVVPARFGEF
jgi:hypothetical protein